MVRAHAKLKKYALHSGSPYERIENPYQDSDQDYDQIHLHSDQSFDRGAHAHLLQAINLADTIEGGQQYLVQVSPIQQAGVAVHQLLYYCEHLHAAATAHVNHASALHFSARNLRIHCSG